MKINVSIDDISTHPQSSVKVLEQCERILSKYPRMKFTLFIPTCFTRLGQQSYPISENADFCNTIRSLGKQYEIGWHGHFHGIIGKSNNNEFTEVDYEEAMRHYNYMKSEAEKAGLIEKFKPIFRPPSLKMSGAAIRAAHDFGIKILCLSSMKHARSTYNGEDEKYTGKIVCYNCNPPNEPLQLSPNVKIMYHACEWDKSYLSKAMADNLMAFIEKNKEYLEPAFMGEL